MRDLLWFVGIVGATLVMTAAFLVVAILLGMGGF